MTKISQLSDIGGSLAAGDEFVIRDVSDISTPNKKVTASGFIDYVIAQGVGSGFTQISAGATAPASVRCFSSGTTREIIFTTSGVEGARFNTARQFLIGAISAVGTTYAGNSRFQLHDDGVAAAQIFTHRSTGSEYPAILELARSRGSFASPTAVIAEDKISACVFHGYDGTNYIRAAAIDAVIDGTPGANDMPGRLVFSTTADGSAGPTERMRITSAGNVGIGTASPSNQLQLSTDSAGKPSTNTWTIVSDERIKEDIELADLDLCYQAVKDIPLKRFKWKDEVYTDEQVRDRHKLGWIAQDVEAVYPKAVGTHEFKYNQIFEEITIPAIEEKLDEKGNMLIPAQPGRIEQGNLISEDVIEDCRDLNSDQLYAAMYGAIQKLIGKVETLETEIAVLKSA